MFVFRLSKWKYLESIYRKYYFVFAEIFSYLILFDLDIIFDYFFNIGMVERPQSPKRIPRTSQASPWKHRCCCQGINYQLEKNWYLQHRSTNCFLKPVSCVQIETGFIYFPSFNTFHSDFFFSFLRSKLLFVDGLQGKSTRTDWSTLMSM